MSFYMVAGTVNWEQGADTLAERLRDAGWTVVEEEGDLLLHGPASLELREAFGHEFLLVGNHVEESILREELQRLGQSLQRLEAAHAWELHAPDNRQIDAWAWRSD